MGADVIVNANDDNSHVSLHILPDSIKEVITGKQFLLYDYGHHGKNWCLIYEDGDSYKIRIGTTRMKKPDLEAKIDTALLIAHYRDLEPVSQEMLTIGSHIAECFLS